MSNTRISVDKINKLFKTARIMIDEDSYLVKTKYILGDIKEGDILNIVKTDKSFDTFDEDEMYLVDQTDDECIIHIDTYEDIKISGIHIKGANTKEIIRFTRDESTDNIRNRIEQLENRLFR